ncbi:hypothetical protein PsYK624_014880 [Phanerochaete sordida]|uniref:DUF6699 domain-containing protein n=1 Tax=Phanerochaete sordida TaxID=48140 RepID=A0A9P3FZZ5_9APHY|nr:hypothetical protein PsYK624_014880 [Phanerochaete sordida]
MPSVFRNWFGSSSSNNQSTPKSHSRSKSTPSNIYATAPTGVPLARPETHRGHSYSTSHSHSAAPSPLRYATATPDTRSAYGYGRRGSSSSHTSDLRPQVLKRASTKAAPIYTSSAGAFTPASSRSNSNSSLFTTMSSVPYSSSRSDTGHHHSHAPYADTRPPLTSNNSWQTAGSVGSASSYGEHGRSRAHSQPSAYVNPRQGALHMHPLLAHTRLHRAPVTYDVSFSPSARTVLDRATHSAIPAHTLAQPATDPPTPSSSKLILRSDKFPWPVIVSGSGPRFTIGPPKSGRSGSANAITILDVLHAVHTTLWTPITPEEWEALGSAQKKVAKRFEARCERMSMDRRSGVRRIDWLGEKTKLVGVEVDKSAGVGKLVFSK